MVLNILLIVIVVFIAGGLSREGVWSNLITLFNAIISAIVATCYFEPAANAMTSMVMPSAVHVWDIMSAGAIFAFTFFFLRTITKKLSPYRVRLHPMVDNFGSVVLSLTIGWVAICFICFTLHLAPLTRNFFDGTFDAEKKMFWGLAPDRLWLGFIQSQSNGGGLGRNETDAQGRVVSKFDPKSEFLVKYASRRTWLDGQESLLID